MYFQDFYVWSAFGFPSHSRRSLRNELARRREDFAISGSQLLVIGRLAQLAFFCAYSIVMMN